ncbi:uncharacterized protein PHACADRAFT_265429 [Phanerochaete carnosa HHB-10118-sp]|uniref:Cytochrome P450 n=1 Tax=Phanerochaete carnosa (strain HHB-10118-sp) TaxID=650164 RepID=K5VSL6_PHACS|nr:uncharacterized protein PHACADRAFT_265429 [Phanerochaete carnosa HHB-10118-sp]EKM49765.1 hypothetical protein PHACADRAFT_265429 [Phanerochaete carnosa HHB-10118-sp]
MTSSLQLILLAALAWALWRLFRTFVIRSPLDNIPGPQRSSFWTGNIKDLFNRHGWNFHDTIAQQYGPVSKVYTAFGGQGLYVYDPKALNSIIVKDQYTYEEPTWVIKWGHMILGPTLFATLGEHHRKQRKMLNPVFSTAHMRHMTSIFYNVVHRLREAVSTKINDNSGEVNVIEWTCRTALELIGQGGLGYSFDPLVASSTNDFGVALKEFMPTSFSLHIWRTLTPYLTSYIPIAIRRQIIRWVPHKNAQKMRAISETLAAHSRGIYEQKMAALARGDDAVVHQIGEGKDVLSILIRANIYASEEDRLPEEEIIAQISGLVLAATDTTSNALARTLHLLSERQDVQDKVRAELVQASPDGEHIPYDQLVDLPYLDAVCRETLRLYPPVAFLGRETRNDIVMPLSEPVQGLDGRLVNEILVPKDTPIFISIWGCNRNPAIWGEDALEWKPERWLTPLPKALGEAHVPGIYANLMTFLGGGRACLGFKFSQLEMKVVLAVMLHSFRFHPSDKEIYWNLASVNYPSVGKESTKAEMPMKVEAIQV